MRAQCGALLVLLTLAGCGVSAPQLPGQPAPTAVYQTPTTAPTSTWRPKVKVDWSKYPANAQATIDQAGARRDCDELATLIDHYEVKDRRTHRAVVAYIDAWFDNSDGLCVDVYTTTEPKLSDGSY